MEVLIILFPFLGFFFSLFFGRFLGNYFVCSLTIFLIFLSLLISIYLFYFIGVSHNLIIIKFLPWFYVYNLKINWFFLFDSLTIIMLIVVLFISLLVHIYSIDYMRFDPHLIRFFSYLSLFTFFMLILVTSGNFIQLFLGWEGVGICSYLLINFWFTRKQANKSAIKAIIINRIGDLGLLIGIFVLYKYFLSLDFFVIFPLIFYIKNEIIYFCGNEFNILNIICFFLFLGAMGKSAQLGLHMWLPDAMEGPTPVSALIHAATMVTAGIFLIIRCSPLFEFSEFVLNIIIVIGSLTAFFAATVGIFQNDIKKVIAYSTCSQLGYMIFCCGLSGYNFALFHLYNHAFFKALLFLSAGAIIHAIEEEQDMRNFGGLLKLLPYIYVLFLIGSLSLMGFPFLTGFYSKDMILELVGSSFSFVGILCYWLGLISAFFTAFYSIRLLYLTFWSKPRNYYKIYKIINNHESLFFMLITLTSLALCSIFMGYLSKEIFIGLGSDFFENSLFILPEHNSQVVSEFLPNYIKNLPIVFSFLGMFLFLFLYNYFYNIYIKFNFSILGNNIYKFLNQKWFFDLIGNFFFVKFILYFGYNITYKLIDKGVIEFFGAMGFSKFFYEFSNKYILLHSGYIYHYIFIMIIGLILILFFLIGILSFFFIKIFLIFIFLGFFTLIFNDLVFSLILNFLKN